MAGYHNQKGFLLIEVLVATVIISIALVAAAGMFIQSTKANSDADRYTVATALAQRQLELLKTRPLSFWQGVTAKQDVIWQGEEVIPADFTNYQVTASASPCPEDTEKLVEVIVAVKWNSQELVMTSFYSRLP